MKSTGKRSRGIDGNLIRGQSARRVLAAFTVALITGQEALSQAKAVVVAQDSRGAVVDYFPQAYQSTEVLIGNLPHLYFQESERSRPPGAPGLPQESFVVGIPPSGGVHVSLEESRSHATQAPALAPVASFEITDEAIPKVSRVFDSFPLEQKHLSIVELKNISWLRDQRIAVILINPLRHEGTGELTTYSWLRIKITFENPALPSVSVPDPLFESTYRSLLVNYEQARLWRSVPQPSTSARTATADSTENWFSPDAEYLKTKIANDGIYRIPFEEIQTFVSPNADPRKFDLLYKGKPIPFRVIGEGDGTFGPGDTLEFWGTRLYDSIGSFNEFTDTSVYWLSVSGNGENRTFIDTTTSGSPNIVITRTFQRIHMDRDSFYYFGDFGLPANNQTDRVAGEGWYWRKLFAGQSTGFDFVSRNFYQIGNPTFVIRGKFHSPVIQQSTPNHDIEVSLNGTSLGRVQFPGYSDAVFELNAPSSLFIDGTNRITVRSDPTGASLNEVFLDWVEADVLKNLRADADTLVFFADEGTPGQQALFDLTGFTSPDISVYRIDPFGGLEKKSSGVVSGASGDYTISFYDTLQPGRSYVALTEARKMRTARIEKKTFVDLRSASLGADYLVVTGKELAAEAKRLAQYREQQRGWRTQVVLAEDIYDEFNFGHFDPAAIRRFIQASDSLWVQPKPAVVVFFGDANWDYKDNFGTGKTNIVPSYGNPVSDTWFVESPSSPFLPQKSIGRIPARSLVDAERFVNMVMAYEATPASLWNKTFMFMAAGFNANETARFQQFSDQMINQYVISNPIAGRSSRLYKTVTSVVEFEQTEEVKQMLRDGALWINFYGHAGTELWGNGISNPTQLQNEEQKRHLVSDISCSTVRFAEPLVNSFAERLLAADDGGAAGYIGSSGFGYESPLRFLADRIFRGISQDTIREPGLLLLNAKTALWQTGTASTITQQALQQLSLLGDPAVEIAVARRPDFALEAGTLFTSPEIPSEADEKVSVGVPVANLGLASPDSLRVRWMHVFESEAAESFEIRVPAPRLKDTLTISDPVLKRGGIHRIAVQADPLNEILEESESNNNAEMVFFVTSGQLQVIRPHLSSSVHPDSVAITVQNPNLRLTPEHRLLIEIDTSIQFSSTGKLFLSDIPLGVLTTTWNVLPNLLADSMLYYWRARVYSGSDSTDWITAYFLTKKDSQVRWIQERSQVFRTNTLDEVSFGSAMKLLEQEIPVEVTSAGFEFGSEVSIFVNQTNISLGFTNRGYNIAVMNQYSGNVEAFAAFDIHQMPDTAGLAQFLEAIPYGRSVLVAVSDEGANNKTERINQAIESLGSALIRSLGFRASWAIIGWKGAPMGSVPEALLQSGEPITLRDTLHVNSIRGTVLTESIGPAFQWRSIDWNVDTVAGVTHVDLDIIRTIEGGTQDTITGVDPTSVPVESILPASVESIRLLATLRSDSAGMSPGINSWSVDYDASAELAVNYQTIAIQKDSVLEGESVTVLGFVHNIGEAAAESVKVSFSVLENNVFSEFSQSVIPLIGPGSSGSVGSGDLPTAGRPLRNTLLVFVDPEGKQRERFVSNNAVSMALTVLRDTVAPTFDVRFDGRQILDGDYIGSAPEIRIGIRDNSPLPMTDPNSVVLRLNDRRITLGTTPDSLFETTSGAEKARVVFRPILQTGIHLLSVQVQDASGNFADTTEYEIRFRVEADTKLLNVVNIPNPFSRETAFTFQLSGTEQPEEARLRIFTVGGRLIYDRTLLPGEVRLGFNQIVWDGRDRDGDNVANGVYFYKIVVRAGEKSVERIEKMARIR